MQVWIGGEKVWQSDPNFPPKTGGQCELSQSPESDLNINVTDYFKNVQPGEIVTFKIRVSVAGEGEGYGRIRILYNPAKVVTEDTWSPQSCLDSLEAVSDGAAIGEATCINGPTDPTNLTDEQGCILINGIQVCEDQLSPSSLPDLSNLCRKARVKVDYVFYQGPMHAGPTDPQGEKHCPVNEGDQGENNDDGFDSCKVYEDNPACGFINAECIEGAKGKSGTCYAFKERYDCGTDVAVPTLEKQTEYQCGGHICGAGQRGDPSNR